MAVFIDIWPCLFTTKLSYGQTLLCVYMSGFLNTLNNHFFLLDLEDESDIGARLKAGAARLQQQTLTNSNILHPDLTEVTNSYPTSGK